MTIEVFTPAPPAAAPTPPVATEKPPAVIKSKRWRSEVLARQVKLNELMRLGQADLELLISELDITIELSRALVLRSQHANSPQEQERLHGIRYRAAVARGFFRASLRERANRRRMRDRHSTWDRTFRRRLVRVLASDVGSKRAQALVDQAAAITTRILMEGKKKGAVATRS